jgi:hypothetical protein
MNLHRLVKWSGLGNHSVVRVVFPVAHHPAFFVTYRLIEKPFNKWEGIQYGYITEFFTKRQKKSVTHSLPDYRL